LGDGALLLAPAFLFLVAAVVAALGFMPKSASLSLEIVDEIRQERDRLIRWRRRFGIFAFILFLLAVVVAILVSALAILHIVGR
jgi:hypothetical protein